MAGPDYSREHDVRILLISDEDRKGREAYIFLKGEGVAVSKPQRIETAMLDKPGDSVWIELSHDDAKIETWLSGLQNALSGVPATIVVPYAMLDMITARLDGAEVEILVDPEIDEKITALALMKARCRALLSGAREANEAGVGADLERLSQEVAWIASSLAILTQRSGPSVRSDTREAPGPVDADQVRREIQARRRRYDHFDHTLFSDPAWDMLLELTEADLKRQEVPVSALCMAANVPPTTALRWIRTMCERDIFRRRPDAQDGRRVFIELEPDARAAMHCYFASAQA
ncbi:MarR family winged helix-turn-helix transcriptional regulator [Sphingomicrobium marinum]|uniref:MarR family winged helix-turn-helix transcriptional regulator n=1 Tax=Sphingomicrobium marinum TaxID=1227950 RepID=UPI00223F14B8|nr:MarR family winged helix-turn-helix transcriptional regulator [Sphingomicrobium marinum]